MSNEQLAQMYALVEKAKMMEKIGKEEEALRLYLEIHEKYFPNTSFLFERPAILLEKRKRYKEAAAICEKAISLIETNHITGTKEPFQKRLERINEKMGISKDNVKEVKKKTSFFKDLFKNDSKNVETKKIQKKKDITDHNHDLPEPSPNKNAIPDQFEERLSDSIDTETTTKKQVNEVPKTVSVTEIIVDEPKENIIPVVQENTKNQNIPKKKIKLTTKGIMIIGVIGVAIGGLGFWLSTYENDYYKDLEADLSAFYNDSGVDYLKSKPYKNEASEDLPVITADMVETSTRLIRTNPGVLDATIVVKGDNVGFFIKVDGTVTSAGAEKLAESYLELLAQQAVLKYPEMLVSKSAFGGLYDYYNALMIVGGQGSDIKAQGTLISKQDKIRWKNGN